METTPGRRESPHADRGICALAMVICGLAISLANNLDLYQHIGVAICGLSVGIAACCAAVMLPSLRKWRFGQFGLAVILGLAIGVQAAVAHFDGIANAVLSASVAGAAILAVARPFSAGWRRVMLLVVMASVFIVMAVIAIRQPGNTWSDVYMSQQKGCQFLLGGVNPYSAKYPNIYGSNTPLYAPGMVDATNHLKFGLGYPPLSLLMVLPAYLLAGDVRYALAACVALSAVLIGMAHKGPLSFLAAAALLAAPLWPRILVFGWTEPLLIFNFSLMMFCACRWRPGLPWALGLFLATKQYAILALPLLPLLLEPGQRRQSLFKTAVVLAIVNLPFFLWNPVAFMRSLVVAHFMQAFRPDALSYPAWIYRHTGGLVLPMWAALLAIIAAYGESLWRGVRSPAGFAAALALVLLVFFAFNKQAFCNYYYFMIAGAWWSVAAAQLASEKPAREKRVVVRRRWNELELAARI